MCMLVDRDRHLLCTRILDPWHVSIHIPLAEKDETQWKKVGAMINRKGEKQ